VIEGLERAGEERPSRRAPWLKVLVTAVAGAAGIVGSGAGPELIGPSSLALGVAGPVLGVLLVAVSLLVTAASPFRAVASAARLLLRWRRLPRGPEPLAWSILVALAEEGVFRLAAFAWLPPAWWAVGLVSLAFAALHVSRIARRRRPWRVAAATFVFSVALCLAYLWSGSFWLVAVAHLAHNLALDRIRQALALRAAEGEERGDGGAPDAVPSAEP
jgi:membrane protease YdiL (CAAX protease family)